jgi:hypothetical protein
MSKTFVYDRFDMIAGDGPGLYPEPAGDGEWVKAEDAINRDAVLTAQIRTLEAEVQYQQSISQSLRQENRYLSTECKTLGEARRVSEIQKAAVEDENRQLKQASKQRSTD